MTKYIKTGTTEFEQFDGSDEMMDKYHVIEKRWSLGGSEYFLKTVEDEMEFFIGDWIATCANGEHWPVKDEIFHKTYKKLPKLTRPVSRYLEFCKEHWNLNDAFLNAEYLVPSNGALEVFDYLSEHPDDFSRAWLDGYEIAEIEE